MKTLGVMLAFIGTLLAISLLVTWDTPNQNRQSLNAQAPKKQSVEEIIDRADLAVEAATGLIPITPLGTIDKPATPTLASTTPGAATVPILAPIAKADVNIAQRRSKNATPPNPVLDTQPPVMLESLSEAIPNAGSPPEEPPKVFVFWEPFNTRASATGFANTLTAMADIPLEVIAEPKIGGRQYRVVLPFRDEAEREARIEQLQAVTGFQVR